MKKKNCKCINVKEFDQRSESCGVDGTRTHDLLVANEMLYQTELRPLFIKFILAFQIIFCQSYIKYKTPLDYIQEFKDIAIAEELRTGIPACVTLAQAIVESNYGNTPLAILANNHFGLKCKKDWKGETFFWRDDTANECFRKYQSPQDSYIDRSNHIMNNSRYKHLFKIPKDNYKEWVWQLWKAGYATHPHYPKKVINVIERYKLCEIIKVDGVSNK